VNRYLSPKVSQQIYYLLKESLSNVIKHAKASHVSISIIFMPDHFSVEIKDNGKGIDKSVRENIFEKFFRADTNSTLPGLGLGLYYVKQCLQIHEWEISFESKLGHGTEFLIRMPRNNYSQQ